MKANKFRRWFKRLITPARVVARVDLLCKPRPATLGLENPQGTSSEIIGDPEQDLRQALIVDRAYQEWKLQREFTRGMYVGRAQAAYPAEPELKITLRKNSNVLSEDFRPGRGS